MFLDDKEHGIPNRDIYLALGKFGTHVQGIETPNATSLNEILKKWAAGTLKASDIVGTILKLDDTGVDLINRADAVRDKKYKQNAMFAASAGWYLAVVEQNAKAGVGPWTPDPEPFGTPGS